MIHSSVVFPVEYCFIPQTCFHDSDPLDNMVLSYEPLEVGCIVKARPVGLLVMEDESGEDPKILAVLKDDPRFSVINNIPDVQQHLLKEIREFFETYKRLEPHKWSKFKAWRDLEDAEKLIEQVMDIYIEKIAENRCQLTARLYDSKFVHHFFL